MDKEKLAKANDCNTLLAQYDKTLEYLLGNYGISLTVGSDGNILLPISKEMRKELIVMYEKERSTIQEQFNQL